MAENCAEQRSKRRPWGQSLVETALFMPIFLIIIAGVVEISNLIVHQSRVDAAVRTATRFGAQGGIDEGMRLSLLNSVTQTLSLDPEAWDVWIVRGEINDNGNDYVAGTWEFNHIYGMNATDSFSDVNEVAIQQEVLASLQQDGAFQDRAGGIEFVGMLAYHDVGAILGLDTFLQGLNTVRGFAVMRIVPVATAIQTNGCSAFPLAVEVGIRSIVPTDDGDPTTGAFPNPDEFEYPSDPADQPVLGDFFYNIPSPESMLTAPPGYIFRVPWNHNSPPEAATVNFVRWDWYGNENWQRALSDSLRWPGNSTMGCDDPKNGDVGWEHPVLRCSNDNQLHIGDPVQHSEASQNPTQGVKDELEVHVDNNRVLQVLLFDVNDPPQGIQHFPPQQQRKVVGFVQLRLLGYNLRPSHDNWMLFEMVEQTTHCGIPAN
jgi:hypothetical protein